MQSRPLVPPYHGSGSSSFLKRRESHKGKSVVLSRTHCQLPEVDQCGLWASACTNLSLWAGLKLKLLQNPQQSHFYLQQTHFHANAATRSCPKGQVCKGMSFLLGLLCKPRRCRDGNQFKKFFCSWFHVFHLHLKRWLFQLVLMDRSRGLLTDYALMGLTALSKQIIDLWLSAFVSWWFQERTDRH